MGEKSQSEEAIYCMIPTKWHSAKGRAVETVKKKISACQDWGKGGMNQSGEDRILGQWDYFVS